MSTCTQRTAPSKALRSRNTIQLFVVVSPKPGLQSAPVRIWVSGSKKQGLQKFTWRSTVLLLEAGLRIRIMYVEPCRPLGSIDLTSVSR